jgi:hypothetical protein
MSSRKSLRNKKGGSFLKRITQRLRRTIGRTRTRVRPTPAAETHHRGRIVPEPVYSAVIAQEPERLHSRSRRRSSSSSRRSFPTTEYELRRRILSQNDIFKEMLRKLQQKKEINQNKKWGHGEPMSKDA